MSATAERDVEVECSREEIEDASLTHGAVRDVIYSLDSDDGRTGEVTVRHADGFETNLGRVRPATYWHLSNLFRSK